MEETIISSEQSQLVAIYVKIGSNLRAYTFNNEENEFRNFRRVLRMSTAYCRTSPSETQRAVVILRGFHKEMG